MILFHLFAIITLYSAGMVSVVSALSPFHHCSQEDVTSNNEPKKAEEVEDQSGVRPLHAAVAKCHQGIIQLLMDFGADPMLVDARGNTALHLAAGCPNATQTIVEFCDVNAVNGDNATALHIAVRAMDVDSVSTLLQFGALANLTDRRQRTAIDEAIATRNHSIIDLFKITVTVSPNRIGISSTTTTPAPEIDLTTAQTTIMGLSPVTASTKRPIPTRVILKKPGVRENEFLKAAERGLEGAIADLCADGINPNFADVTNNNLTPLHLAAKGGEVLALMTLIACGAKVNAIDREGNTPLHIAALRNNSWSSAVLLFKGADPHIAQRQGKTAYQIAKESKDVGMGSVFNDKLLAWYGNVRRLEGTQKELLHYVRMGRYASGVAKLCIAGADVNIKDADNKERTALHVAVSIQYNILLMIQTLVRCGGNVNARDAEGNTPLHLAAMEGKDEAFTGLLLQKADPFLTNFQGKTANDLAGQSKSDFIKWTSTYGAHRYHWYQNNKFA